MENKSEKVCTFCGESKPLSRYFKNGKNGLHTRCKDCMKAVNETYYQNNRWSSLQTMREYAQSHKKELKAYHQRYRKENAKRINAKQAEGRDRRYFDGKREIVLWRDFYQCRKCGSLDDLVVHHIDGNGRGKTPNNDTNNLITLCKKCHINEHRGGLR